MSERHWTILGYDGGAKTFEQSVPVDVIAESDVKELLRRLVARHWSEEQVVAASLSSTAREPILEIAETAEGPFGFTTDANYPRYYVAILGDVADEIEDLGAEQDA
ncbi:hypothetical protein [Amaricoccus sp.]|uniref:hypothetical protein n=1 Tax=Amaricoccus sp. TaxID=1872485 RepID=UPI00261A0E86|nr:hypothetical protein [uncultured Amaricoccus sp.]